MVVEITDILPEWAEYRNFYTHNSQKAVLIEFLSSPWEEAMLHVLWTHVFIDYNTYIILDYLRHNAQKQQRA